MQFEQFKTVSTDAVLSTGFIRSITHLTYQSSVHLLCCEFDPQYYSDHVFSLYGISRPSDLYKAVPKRKAEFLAGRVMAKQALTALGGAENQLQVGVAEDRSPVWPYGVTGSITHTTGFAACCVCKTKDVSILGIDSELLLSEATAQSLAADIHNTAELDLLIQVGFSAALATTLIFSAKESLYKALYPKVRCFFGFETARLSKVEPQTHNLTLVLSDPFAELYGLKTQYKIQFCIKDTVVHTLLMQ